MCQISNFSFVVVVFVLVLVRTGESYTQPISHRILSFLADGKLPVFTEKVTNIADLTPVNGYEAQVLSGLENFRGRKISNYFFPENGSNDDLNEAKNYFYQSLPPNAFDINEKKQSNKTYTPINKIECDLYFCSDEPIPCITSFLDMSTEEVWNLTDVVYKAPSEGNNWIFVEITQGSRLLAQKIWQLERAAILLPIHDVSYTPSAAIVLLNGEREDAEAAVRNMKIPENFKISKLPVYVGWTPTRNIHREFRILRKDLKSIQASVATQSVEIAVLTSQMSTQSGQMSTQTVEIAALTSQMSTQSGQIAVLTSQMSTQSGQMAVLSVLVFLSSFVSILLNFMK